ncbi:hypothetical protein [Deinococcus radiophilus]|uniref:hypothetical protein n=1 Tax=Deinococcus radiophilus TaxID=32062 RepID=UPI00147534A6|nr:hypothetical protein [Deinococcus radiophilus]UFA49515.1 hypothetical protein LMT64_06285 [Deinococcus radiophilus]
MAGYELAGVGGVDSVGQATAETWLVLRCNAQPQRRLEREYWPGGPTGPVGQSGARTR